MTRELSIALFALSLYGCARCSDEPRVPFKLNPPPEVPQVDTPVVADAGVGAVTAFPQPADNPVVAGQPLPLAGVRALYEVDVDRDGDQDVLALTADATQHVQLAVFTRDAALSAPRPVPGFVSLEPGACTIADARFFSLSKEKAALRVELQCSAQQASAALWLLALEATPRIYERVDVLASSEGHPALSLLPRSLDSDGDQHDDIAVRISAYGALEADSLELTWLDRPSGLVRDLREPEATLSAWAAAAQSQIAKQTDAAVARAELGLTLARAICRELGSAQLALSGVPGIGCGTLPSLGALSTTLIGAYARRGDVARAFDQYRGLRASHPSERLLDLAQAALAKLPAASGVTLRNGPAVEPITQPRVHLPSARFLSDSSLFVHRLNPILWDLDSGSETPAPRGSEALLRDPSGQLIASGIERTCDGLAVRIERAPPPGSDYTSAAPLANALLLPLASAPGCTRASHRPDDGGFSVLGWAPQGLVAVRGSEVRLVPLASNGRASGEPRLLAPGSPRPAPLPAGVATRDGARYVEATPYGVLLYGPSSDQVELWRPEGYLQIAKGPLEAAISPTARRVALVAGGSVYVLERVH
ncbi:MAG TPA: hypothetical protein VFX59_31080 [Polyangiales bacterium]|nr:hypothetical protein [Polyangiales bacterium]